jgi:O-antigen/teichoic acid export membrane protein
VTDHSLRARGTAALRNGSAIAVAVMVTNVAAYAFTIVAARWLGPLSYGAFAAAMNVLLVTGVVQLALQTTAARRIAREPLHVEEVEDAILRVGWRTSLVLGGVLLLLSPLVARALRFDDVATAAALAVAVAPTTLFGAQAGILQGERRWIALGLLYFAVGVPRLVLGALALWVQQSELAAMIGVAVSACIPIALGEVALRRARGQRQRRPHSGDHTARDVWWETVRNGQALLAFLVLSNVDIVLARNILSPHDAGLYAGGLILVKAVLFMPQFVVVVAFPSMGTEHTQRRALLGSLGLVALIGVAVTVGVAVLSGLALQFVGGSEYDGIRSSLWLFAVLGTVLSMLQLLAYSVVARQARRSIILLWAGLVGVVVAGSLTDSVRQLATTVTVVDSVLLAVLLAVSLWRRPAAADRG